MFLVAVAGTSSTFLFTEGVLEKECKRKGRIMSTRGLGDGQRGTEEIGKPKEKGTTTQGLNSTRKVVWGK